MLYHVCMRRTNHTCGYVYMYLQICFITFAHTYAFITSVHVFIEMFHHRIHVHTYAFITGRMGRAHTKLINVYACVSILMYVCM